MQIADPLSTADSIAFRFAHSRKAGLVSTGQIRERIVTFLEHCLDAPLVSRAFADRITGETGEARLASLLENTGYAGDVHGFIRELVSRLERLNHTNTGPLEVGEVVLPPSMLLGILELLIPGGGFKTVKKVSQLEELTNTRVPPDEREDMQRVLELYPVRLSLHTIRQMRLSRDVAYQYMPFTGELNPEGEVHTWVGQFFRGIVEQMYRNRVIFVMNMSCPVYCRFCFRKHKECRLQRAPKKEHVRQALIYIHSAPSVSEIVLTGGDPFMNRATLQYAVQELGKVPHVKVLRLASRAVSYYPELFLRDNAYWLSYLLRVSMELRLKGKRLELATHFIHPDEISYEALDVITHLTRNGVPVYVQTPFVAGCNESGQEMVELFNVLRSAGAEIHYIFMPTSPIRGNRAYWSPISSGLKAGRYLRAHLSDRAIPHLTTATSIGKVDWNTSGWAVAPDAVDPRRIWIRTPYTEEYYEPFAPILQHGGRVRPNAEGTLDAVFMTDIGDPDLFTGPRNLSSSPEAHQYKLQRTAETTALSLEPLGTRFLQDQRRLDVCLGAGAGAALARDHMARVELDCDAAEADLSAALAYIAGHPAITDVVLSRREDIFSGLSRTVQIIERLRAIPNVLAVRLRSFKLAVAPDILPRAAVARLAPLNRLQPVGAFRLEVETQFIHSSMIRPELARVVDDLRQNGITVYNNTPLLGDINDNEEEMHRISSACRALGIEFNNIIIAGLPVQQEWNRDHPIELNSVIDIATMVRRHGSGREIPRYVLRTALGEVDFSVAPPILVEDNGVMRVRLLEQTVDHFRSIDPAFEWPEGVTLDEDGQPLVPVTGVRLEGQAFFTAPDTGPVDEADQGR